MAERRMTGEGLSILDEQGGEVLLLKEQIGQERVEVSLHGVLSAETTSALEDELLLAALVCGRLEVECSGVTGASGAALQALLNVHKLLSARFGGRLLLRAPGEKLLFLLAQTGLDEIFAIRREKGMVG